MATAKYVPDVPREKIIEAMEQFDEELRDTPKWKGWDDRRNHKFAIKFNEKLYPEKEIICLATGASRGSFAGGPEAIGYLEERGFTVVRLKRDEEDYIFKFAENDFSEKVDGTVWRGQLSRLLKQDLAEITGEVIGGGAVYGRHELLFHDRRYDKKFVHPKLFFRLDVEERSCSFGFYIEKGIAESKEPGEIMDDTWAWNALAGKLEDKEFTKGLEESLVKNDLEIALDLWGPDERYVLKPENDHLEMVRIADGSKQVFSWKQFADYLTALPASQWCDFHIRKELKVGTNLSISLEPILDTYEAVTPYYYSVLRDNTQEALLYLLGAAKKRDEVEPYEEFIEKHGKFASWWSYPIRDKYQDLVRKNLPISMLIYQGGELFVEWRIADFVTSHGGEGLVSPWPDYTLEEERDKAKMGDKASYICKTWFLVDRTKQLISPEKLEDYIDYETNNLLTPQSLINSFGYVKQRESGGVGEVNDLYDFFTDRGFHFSQEVLTNYCLALKTKPFVILSGISGTGKTKIAQIFADFMCPEEQVAVKEAPENGELDFYTVVGKTTLNHGRLSVTSKNATYFDIPERGTSHAITVEFSEKQTAARIFNLGFTDPKARYVFVEFKKEMRNWIEGNFNLGDIMKITVLDDDMTRYRVEKYEPEVRTVSEKRLAFISVRPDWMDNRGLLGFYNLLTDEYQPTELLKLMLRAKEDPGRPYFVVLDEMNLAKVEYYFSDFLSCMESRMPGDGEDIKQEPVKLHDKEEEIEFIDSDGRTYYIPPAIEIPTNLYFSGTVNVDETTYMFSPKVLDRANTIEFNEVDLFSYGSGQPPPTGSAFRVKKDVDIRTVFGGAELATDEHYRSLQADLKSYLEKLNNLLKPHHMHFGYRVANEVSLYLKNAIDFLGPESVMIALDLQILQKVLPKFHGSRQKLERPLLQLLEFCLGEEVENDPRFDAVLLKAGEQLESAPFPRTASKVLRMLGTLGEQGFVSFVE